MYHIEYKPPIYRIHYNKLYNFVKDSTQKIKNYSILITLSTMHILQK